MKRSTKMLLMNTGKEKGRHFGFEYDDWKMKDRLPYPDRVEDVYKRQVTGNLADALNWVGISEESVNEQLGELANSTERTRYLMDLLSQQYGDAADSFYKNNEALIEARNAQADLDDMTSQLGESVANLKNTFFETFGPFLTDLIEIAIPVMEGLGWVIEKVGDALAFVKDLVFDLGQAFGNFISGV